MLERWDELSRRDEPNAELSGGEEGIKSRRYRRSSSEDDAEEIVTQRPNTRWNWFRESVKRFANGNHFTRGILVAILINTIR